MRGGKPDDWREGCERRDERRRTVDGGCHRAGAERLSRPESQEAPSMAYVVAPLDALGAALRPSARIV